MIFRVMVLRRFLPHPRLGRARLAAPADLALVAVSAVWGLGVIVAADAVQRIPPASFLLYRFVPAALLVIAVFHRPLRALPRNGWLAGVGLGLLLTAVYVLQTLAVRHTTASNAGFITGLHVVFTALFAAVLLRQRLEPVVRVAIGLATLGLALLAGVGGALHPLGDGLSLGCAALAAGHILATDRAVRAHPVGALLAVQLGVCAALSAVWAALAGQTAPPAEPILVAEIAFAALVATALAFFVQSTAQRAVPPERTALILTTEPAFAAAFAYGLLGERLTLTALAGAGLLVLALVLAEARPALRLPARRPRPAAALASAET